MTIPSEIREPIKDFISNNWLVILIISVIIGCALVTFLGKNIEKEFEMVIESETE